MLESERCPHLLKKPGEAQCQFCKRWEGFLQGWYRLGQGIEAVPLVQNRAVAAACRRRFSTFFKEAWNVLRPGKRLVWTWYLEALCDHVQWLLEEWRRNRKDKHYVAPEAARTLLVSIPPGSGKTLALSIMAPAWMWIDSPEWSCLCLSINPMVARDAAVECRALVTSHWYRSNFVIGVTTGEGRGAEINENSRDSGLPMDDGVGPPKSRAEHFDDWADAVKAHPAGVDTALWSVSEDRNTMGKFVTTRGGYRASQGMTAQIIGARADCVAGETLVATEHGDIAIKDLHAMKHPPRVWSCSEEGKLELRRIVASRAVKNRPVVTVRAGSNVLTCTRDHKVFTEGHYTQAAHVTGRELSVLQRTERPLEIRQAQTLSQVRERQARVSDMLEGVRDGRSRVRQEAKKPRSGSDVLDNVLVSAFAQARQRSSEGADDENMRDVQQGVSSEYAQGEALLSSMFRQELSSQTGGQGVRGVRRGDACDVEQDSVLFDGLQEQSTLQVHAGEHAQGTDFGSSLRRGFVGESCSYDSRARRESLYGVRIKSGTQGASCAPYRRERQEQRARESDNSLRFLSQHPPQEQDPTIRAEHATSVTGRGQEIDVYDIQVEGNHNFFANGILVHNCLLIDDPNDPRASSDEYAKTNQHYADVLYNRVNDMEVAVRITIQQRLGPTDLTGFIKRTPGAKTHLCLPLLHETDRTCETTMPVNSNNGLWLATDGGKQAGTWKDPRTIPGQILSKRRWPPEAVSNLKANGNFGAICQQDPDRAEGEHFEEKHWRFWVPATSTEEERSTWKQQRPLGCNLESPALVIPVDSHGRLGVAKVWVTDDPTSGSTRDTASHLGLLICAETRDPRTDEPLWLVVHDCDSGPRSPAEQRSDLDKAIYLAARMTGHDRVRVLVEDKSNGKDHAEDINAHIASTAYDGLGVTCELYKTGNTQAKENRDLAVLDSPHVRGQLLLRDGATWVKGLVSQFRRFPREPNDKVDCIAQLVAHTRPTSKGWGDVFLRAVR